VISVIIPTLNEQDYIGSLLDSLSNEFVDKVEIIVVDGGSSDGTTEIVSHYQEVMLIASEEGRAIQFNFGAQHSKGEILFFIHADSQLPDRWREQIMDIVNQGNCVAGTFYLKFDKEGFWYHLYSRLSRINGSIFTYGDQGLFVRKTEFMEIGGYPSLPIMEDYEILFRMRKVGHVTKLDSPITTSARKFSKNGVVLQQLKNITTVIMYIVGVSPSRLVKWYNR